jgi:hypothetical protein
MPWARVASVRLGYPLVYLDLIVERRMRMRCMAATLLLVFALGFTSFAQGANPLVGTWERFSTTDAKGQPLQPQPPAAFLGMTANGYFSQVAIPRGRPKVDKPVKDMTREELVARFDNVIARRGTYKVEGNKHTRRDVVHTDPKTEGTEAVQTFRIEGDVLVLGNTDPANKAENRFRRVK